MKYTKIFIGISVFVLCFFIFYIMSEDKDKAFSDMKELPIKNIDTLDENNNIVIKYYNSNNKKDEKKDFYKHIKNDIKTKTTTPYIEYRKKEYAKYQQNIESNLQKEERLNYMQTLKQKKITDKKERNLKYEKQYKIQNMHQKQIKEDSYYKNLKMQQNIDYQMQESVK